MANRTHYDVLGVRPSADAGAIREAYRRLAREHHPDRAASTGSAVGGGRDMHSINEAYRVLNDPARRAVYDASLRRGPQTGPAAAPRQPVDADDESFPSWTAPQYVRPHDGPARVPWRSLLVAGTVAVAGVVVLAQFAGPAVDDTPDGILRNGDCVEILEPSGDAREVPCVEGTNLVVRAFVAFGDQCQAETEAHRDRQGMGIACVRQEER